MPCALGQKYCCLAGRISTANDDDVFVLAELRLDKGRAVIDSSAFKPSKIFNRQSSVLCAGSDHDGACRDSATIFQFDDVGSAVAGKPRSFGEQHLGTELLRLYVRPRGQIVSGHPRWKTQIVLDPRTGPGLTSGRIGLHQQDVKTFGGTVNRGGQSSRSCADDDQITHKRLVDIFVEPEAVGNFPVAGIVQHGFAATDGHRNIGNGNVELVEQSLHVAVAIQIDAFGADNVRSTAAHHHDDVLGDWNVWRRRVALGAPRQQSFSATEVAAINDLPKKDELLADLNRLLLLAAGIGVIFIDLDNFKTVNDTMGHDAGDKCLEEVARIIGSVVLHKGRLYRYASGDEFMVVLPNVNESEAAATAERIRKAIELQNVGGSVPVTASIGVIVAAEKVYGSAEEILKAADEEM